MTEILTLAAILVLWQYVTTNELHFLVQQEYPCYSLLSPSIKGANLREHSWSLITEKLNLKNQNVQKREKSMILSHVYFDSSLFCIFLFWEIHPKVNKSSFIIFSVSYPFVWIYHSIYFLLMNCFRSGVIMNVVM